MAEFATAVTCHRCSAPGQLQLFCQNCGLFLPDQTGSTERVTFTRRFFGDSWLEGLLIILTLLIGWLIWFAINASKGQSPAKRLLNVYVIDSNTGKAVTAGSMWLRDVVLKYIVIGYIVPFGGLIDGLFVLFDKQRQAVHDKIVSTVVVYAPNGLPEAMLSSSSELIGVGVLGTKGSLETPAPSTANASEQLRELARLRDEGMITSEEYERKRSELASRL
jgi:uncharacterized RDD family membrane protein YckC